MTHRKDNAPKGETPTPSKAPGVSGQNELFELPVFCPILPPVGSAAETALNDLLARDWTTPEWYEAGNGWRLAAAIQDLKYLGWEPISTPMPWPSCKRPIARYSLSAKAKQAAALMQGGAND